MPPEYVEIGRSSASVRSISSPSSSTRRAIAFFGSPYSSPCSRSSSRPVWRGSSAASCNATPMRNRTAPGSRATSKPATVAVPPVGVSNVHSMRTVVDLPAPFGPKNAKISPRPTSRSTPSTAVNSPNVRTSDRRLIAGSLMSCVLPGVRSLQVQTTGGRRTHRAPSTSRRSARPVPVHHERARSDADFAAAVPTTAPGQVVNSSVIIASTTISTSGGNRSQYTMAAMMPPISGATMNSHT